VRSAGKQHVIITDHRYVSRHRAARALDDADRNQGYQVAGRDDAVERHAAMEQLRHCGLKLEFDRDDQTGISLEPAFTDALHIAAAPLQRFGVSGLS